MSRLLPGRLARRRGASGFSLIELMVALVLGLIVTASAIAIFSSNRRTYAATESVARAQEGVRTAFELMSRELRSAGSTPCGNSRGTVVNVLNDAATAWYGWTNDMQGYGSGDAITGLPASGAGSRVAGTDALEVHSGNVGGVTVDTTTVAPGTFTMVGADTGLAANDIVMVCDFVRGAIFQIGSVSGKTVKYDTSGSSPGNGSINLAGCIEAQPCPSAPLTELQPGAVISRLGASRWYIGNNASGGKSLYLQTVRENDPGNQDEVATGVTGMTLSYLVNQNLNYDSDHVVDPATDYVAAATVTTNNAWNRVIAVRIGLTFEDKSDRGDTVTRQLVHTVTLRNHNI